MNDLQTDIEDPAYLGRARQPSDKSSVAVVSNKDLLPLIARAAMVARSQNTVPILSHIVLRAGGGVMTIEANNMEMAIRQQCPVRGADGVACVEATALHALLRQFGSDAEVQFEFGGRLTVRSGAARAMLSMLSIEDFPSFRDLTYAATLTMGGAVLADALARTRPLASTDAPRYYLSGVHLRSSDTGIRFEATDGKVLGLISVDIAGTSGIPNVILPFPPIDLLEKVLTDAPVTISVSVVGMKFETNNITLLTKLVDGAYPEVDRVLPVAGENVWRIRRDAMTRALSLASATSAPGGSAEFTLSEAGGRVVVKEKDNEITVELDDATCSYVGKPCEFKIRLRELSAVLKVAGPLCEFRASADLMWFRVSDTEDARAIYVVGTYR